MSGYCFIHPEPFKRVLRYDYAKCDYSVFLAQWAQVREDLRKRINTTSFNYTELAAGDNSLASLLEKARGDEFLLWSFIKKYEVYGRLYSHYDEFLRKGLNSTHAGVLDYLMFAQVIAEYAERSDCLQYLSTLLKVMDAFCGLKLEELSKANPDVLLNLLIRERILVDRLKDAL